MKKFGEKLRALRKRDGLTLQQLGDMLGVHNTYISKMEQGKRIPNMMMVIKITKIFGVTCDQLIQDELELD